MATVCNKHISPSLSYTPPPRENQLLLNVKRPQIGSGPLQEKKLTGKRDREACGRYGHQTQEVPSNTKTPQSIRLTLVSTATSPVA